MAAENEDLKTILEAWVVTHEGQMPGIEAPRARLTPLASPLTDTRPVLQLRSTVLLVRFPAIWVPQYSILRVESSAGKVTKKLQVPLGQR